MGKEKDILVLYLLHYPRLDYRQTWDKDFRDYLNKLDKTKPVVLCGDLNVAHKEIGG
jgi:exonuclease III